MIKKLPIVIDFNKSNSKNKKVGKILFHNFKIKENNGMITIDVINPYNKLDFVLVPCVNKYNCIYYFKISLPLKIKIINNYLLLPYFFMVEFKSNLNFSLDFFSNLLIYLKSFNNQYRYLDRSSYKKNLCNIYNYVKDIKLKSSFNNVNDFLKNLYVYINYNLNMYFMLLYINVDLSKYSLSKKTLNYLKFFKNRSFSYKESSNYIIESHLNNFKNNKVKRNELVKNNTYFIKVSNEKILRVKIKNIKNNILELDNKINIEYNKYEIFYYPINFKNLLKKDAIFNYYIGLDFKDFILTKLLNKNKINIYKNIIDFYYNNNFDIYNLKIINELNLDILNYEEEYKFINDNNEKKKYYFLANNINPDTYSESIEYFNTDELKKDLLIFLFKKYVFPFKYNRRDLDPTFMKIILLSILNFNIFIDVENGRLILKKEIICHLPIKLKSLYINILKIYFDFTNNNFDNLIYNPKIYNDPIHYDVLKLIFETENSISNVFKYDKVKYDKIKNKIKDVILLIQICKIINWRNVSKNLIYLNDMINNKNLIFFNDKLNKNIVPLNFDNRLKKIIMNPFEMFKYLRKEKDFIKWIYFLDKRIYKLYNSSIIIKEDKFEKLGKLIYLLLNIKSQDLEEESYLYFLDYCNKNSDLVLLNSRINLNIKEYFKFLKINLNLGYLAKHLTWDNDSVTILNSSKINELENKLKSISKKYYKYKGKYIRLKSETESSVSILSLKTNVE
jgi:hypothetical protein